MRIASAPFVLSLALFALPAFAQNSGGNDNFNQPNRQWTQTGPSGSDNQHNGSYGNQGNNQFSGSKQFGSNNQYGENRQFGHDGRFAGNSQNGAGITSDTQRKIRQSLEQNGFRNVQVMPEAFIIRAQAPDGSRVVMEVAPDMIQGVVESSGSSTNHNSSVNHSGSSTSGNWNPQDGSGDNYDHSTAGDANTDR